ncbi:MAG TPA: hypothetical protein VF956_12090 [Candidatus Dormibacteraeota bacterium]
MAAALPATVALGLRHLESQRSLLALGKDSPGLSVLAKKLRLAPDHHVAVINAPPGYLDQLAPAPADLYTALKPSTLYDAVQLFVNNVADLRTLGPSAIKAVRPDGLLWIAYPKGGVTRDETDLPATASWTKRDVLGDITGEAGYKPVAFVKIDDDWTALRFKRT